MKVKIICGRTEVWQGDLPELPREGDQIHNTKGDRDALYVVKNVRWVLASSGLVFVDIEVK